MRITCWGSRGSVPVSGKEFVKYGGDTTCLEIRTKDDHLIIVDAGTGIRRLGNKLMKEHRTEFNFIFTHAHWDHLMGFPFFKPIYRNESHFRMHRCPFPSKYIINMLTRVMSPPNFPVKYSDLKAHIQYEPNCVSHIEIGSMKIIPIALSHPNTGNGYKFIEDGKSFVFLTDNELGFVHRGGNPFAQYVEFVKDVDLLFHDAEYTAHEYDQMQEWGHSSYLQALDLAMSARVKKLGLFHLNQDRTDKQMDRIVNECKQMISEKQMNLDCVAVGSDMEFEL